MGGGRKRLIKIMVTTPLPAVNRPNADRRNSVHSCQYWHEQLAFSQSTGNHVNDHYKQHYFPLFFSFPVLSTFLMEGVLGSKTRGRHLSHTPSAILGPPSGHFGFYIRCSVADGERVPPAPLVFRQNLVKCLSVIENWAKFNQSYCNKTILLRG